MFWSQRKTDDPHETDPDRIDDIVFAALSFAERKRQESGRSFQVVLMMNGTRGYPVDVLDWGPGWLAVSGDPGLEEDVAVFINSDALDSIEIHPCHY